MTIFDQKNEAGTLGTETLNIKRKIDFTHLQIDEMRFWLGKEVDIIISEKTSKSTSSKSSNAGL